MKDFIGKVAVITGASSGIGEAMAWRFARACMKVVIADIDMTGAERVRNALVAAGHAALALRTDVADADSVQALADTAFDTRGSADVLCNNVGVVPSGRYRPV